MHSIFDFARGATSAVDHALVRLPCPLTPITGNPQGMLTLLKSAKRRHARESSRDLRAEYLSTKTPGHCPGLCLDKKLGQPIALEKPPFHAINGDKIADGHEGERAHDGGGQRNEAEPVCERRIGKRHSQSEGG